MPNPDDRIARRVREMIDVRGGCDTSHIQVDVRRGTVRLRGSVDTADTARSLSHLAASVRGVRAVECDLQIGGPPE